MAGNNESYYVFDNLVEASVTKAEDLTQPIAGKVERAKPFSNSNAAGNIPDMSFEDIASRAAQFGARCKAVLDAEASE